MNNIFYEFISTIYYIWMPTSLSKYLNFKTHLYSGILGATGEAPLPELFSLSCIFSRKVTKIIVCSQVIKWICCFFSHGQNSGSNRNQCMRGKVKAQNKAPNGTRATQQNIFSNVWRISMKVWKLLTIFISKSVSLCYLPSIGGAPLFFPEVKFLSNILF